MKLEDSARQTPSKHNIHLLVGTCWFCFSSYIWSYLQETEWIENKTYLLSKLLDDLHCYPKQGAIYGVQGGIACLMYFFCFVLFPNVSVKNGELWHVHWCLLLCFLTPAYSTPGATTPNRFVGIGSRDNNFLNIPQQTQVRGPAFIQHLSLTCFCQSPFSSFALCNVFGAVSCCVVFL